MFSDDDDDRLRSAKTVVRTEPTPAGHGRLTISEVQTPLDADGMERVEFSTGVSPFWTLDSDPYGDGVFPAVEEARDYLSFEETVAGLRYLESGHSDQLSLTTTGRGSPRTNLLSETDERYPIYVAQVTTQVGINTLSNSPIAILSSAHHMISWRTVTARRTESAAISVGRSPISW